MAEQKYITTTEIAEVLSVSEETVRRYIKEGLLPAIKLRGVFRVKREDFAEFLKQSEFKPEE